MKRLRDTYTQSTYIASVCSVDSDWWQEGRWKLVPADRTKVLTVKRKRHRRFRKRGN